MDFEIVLGALALLVRGGQLLLDAGAVRSKNAASAVTRGLTDVCLGVLGYWVVGALVLRWLNARFGYDPGAAEANLGAHVVTFGFIVLAMLTGRQVNGAVAERSRFLTVVVTSLLGSAVIFPVAAHLAWFGWLRGIGFVDVGGAAVVHLTGAMMALSAAVLVGPRSNKFNTDGSTNIIPGHLPALSAAGTMLVAVGWIPYLVMMTLLREGGIGSLAATNALLALAAGGAAGLLLGQVRHGKPDLLLAASGLLGALASITAAPGRMEGFTAIGVAAAAGILVPTALTMLDLRFRIDDPGGGIAIYGVGAAWGTVASGLVAPGSFLDRLRSIGVQALGVVVLAGLALLLSGGVLLLVRRLVGLRVRDADEYDGLDLAEHDLNAYPDFQQTTIKSYHLREA